MAQMALIAIPALISANQQTQAGKIKRYESEVDAAQIETAASQREADRREALASAVSSQSAAAGASGISFEGSPLAILEEDLRLADEGSERDALMARLGADSAISRGKAAEASAKANAAMGLLRAGGSVAGQGFRPSSTSSTTATSTGGIGFGAAGSAGAGKL